MSSLALAAARLSALALLAGSGCVASLDGSESGADPDAGDEASPGADGGDGALGEVERLAVEASVPGCVSSPAGEDIGKLVDGDPTTKFLTFRHTTAIRVDADAPYVLARYALTSANDAPERDPRSWILEGSNDGHRWAPIDVRVGEEFSGRAERREFRVDGAAFHRYYRLQVENGSGNVLQLGELELYGAPPFARPAAAPPAPAADLTATAVARDRIELAWRDGGDDEDLVRIEQSSDGQSWATVGYAPADATGHAVVGLPADRTFTYRVVAENAAGAAAPSNADSARTLPPISRTANGDGTRLYEEGDYSVLVDPRGTAVPETLIERMVAEYFATYPAMAEAYHPEATRDLRITFDPDYEGVAYAVFGTGDVTISSTWAAANTDDVDVITHEGFHIVQAYGNGNTPGWATEGLADFARHRYGNLNTGACWTMQRYEPGQSYTDAYGVTARFLLWLETNVSPTITTDLDDVLRSGGYSDAFWTEATGKTVDQLWADYAADPDRGPVAYR